MSSLERFSLPNEANYVTALNEIRSGHKKSHWIWYIFPQLRGLGMSSRSHFYGIEDIDEAKRYIAHPVLGPRLIEITEALLALNENDPYKIMNADDVKLRSCMTLFACVSEKDSVFHKVLDKFFDGQGDSKTLAMLRKN